MTQGFSHVRDDRTEIIILGSTGSIGQQPLDVVRSLPKLFRIVALSAHRNVSLLEEQIAEFKPLRVAVTDEATARSFRSRAMLPVMSGKHALNDLCSYDSGDVVVNALVGMVGIAPTLLALSRHKTVALANKEAIVSAGALVMEQARKYQAKIIPIDSEHSAIHQCLQGGSKAINRLILTASGGPFRNASFDEMRSATIEQALQHPTWNMGQKISIDSATMMNKGFEIIEAMHLFDLPATKVDVVVHPQSIIHSLVEFVDHSVLAQLGNPDMRVPIQYALSQGKRYPNTLTPLDLAFIGTLSFEPMNVSKFPCLRLAREAAEKGGTYPAVLNAANDHLVAKFLNREIPLTSIAKGVEWILTMHDPMMHYTLADIQEICRWVPEMIERAP